jgi:hypothetical protein
VAVPDLLIPIFDANKNEWSPLHDFLRPSSIIQGLPLESQFLSDLFIPGVGTIVQCSDEFSNIKVERQELQDSAGVHRYKDPTAGSFSYHYNFAFHATRHLLQGEELIRPCLGVSIPSSGGDAVETLIGQPIEWLTRNGICLDSLLVASSTLPGVGRGAFSKRDVASGQVIATTPVVHFDRSQMEIVEQAREPDDSIPIQREHGIKYTDKVTGQQLLLNYAYGHPESNFLLLPYGPGANAINHSHEKANAVVRWAPQSIGLDAILATKPNLMLGSAASHGTLFDYVALRDILPGEEILIDYGDAWSEAWEKHLKEWEPQSKDYVPATEFLASHMGEPIRTESEQLSKPYPENLQTVCYFATQEGHLTGVTEVEWSTDYKCLRPCDVKEHTRSGAETLYTAVVFPIKSAEPDYCAHVPKDGLRVTRMPTNAVGIVNRPYSTDTHLRSAFRHEIGVPDGLYPRDWMAADVNPLGDFISSHLKAGELAHVRWKDTGDIVTPNAYRLGLGDRVRTKILEYCNKIGITDTFRKVTGGNSLQRQQNVFMEMNGDQWYLQRPGKQWQANMHWISPGGEEATQDWLEMLSEAGFDEVLKGIGETLNMTGLVAFHGTFMGVSLSTKHYLHYDVQNTTGKMFNIIIPLLAASETGPEFDLEDSSTTDSTGALKTGRYRYEYDHAMMVGDMASHATSPVDYRMNKEFRMAATVYVADVNANNVDGCLREYTQVR